MEKLAEPEKVRHSKSIPEEPVAEDPNDGTEEDDVDGIDPDDVEYEPTPYEHLGFRVATPPPGTFKPEEERKDEEEKAKQQIFQVDWISIDRQGALFLTYSLLVPGSRPRLILFVLRLHVLGLLHAEDPKQSEEGIRGAPRLILQLHAHHGHHLGRGDEEEIQKLRDMRRSRIDARDRF